MELDPDEVSKPKYRLPDGKTIYSLLLAASKRITKESQLLMNNSQRELPKYKSHKVVRALKISEIELHEDKSVTITPVDTGYAPFKTVAGWGERLNGNEDDAGYYVVYPDGYASWSPSKAFEEGYTKVE